MDYVRYFWSAYNPHYNKSAFKMHVDKSEIKEGIEHIKGRITDKFGVASFKGEINLMGHEGIKFIKRYSCYKEDPKVAQGNIVYEGLMKKIMEPSIEFPFILDNAPSIFQGTYKTKKTGNGYFVLERFPPSITLAFLLKEMEDEGIQRWGEASEAFRKKRLR